MERSTRLSTNRRTFIAGVLAVGARTLMPPSGIRAQGPSEQPSLPIPAFAPKPPTTSEELLLDDCKVMKPVSFYNLTGQTMANGQTMDPDRYTAAIPMDPYLEEGEKIGDHIRLTDPETKKVVLVEITDRGLMRAPPYKDKYVDVSEGVARDMGWTTEGVKSLCYKVIKRAYSR